MAKIRAPLMSVAASGSIAGLMTFRQTRYGSTVQTPPVPRADPSTPQITTRARFAAAQECYRTMPPDLLTKWAASAASFGTTTQALIVSQSMQQRITDPTTLQIPFPRFP